MSGRGIRVRLFSAALAVAVIAGGVAVSQATPADRLEQAKAQLRALAAGIEAQEAAVSAARERAASAATRALQAEKELIALLQRRADLQARATVTQAELDAAQAALDETAVEAFIGSPGTVPGAETLAALLGAQTIEQLQDRLAYGEAVARAQADAVARVQALVDRLTAQAAAQDALIAAAEDLRARRDAAVREQEAAWQQEAQALADLAATRDGVVALIDRLRDRLAPADVEAVADAFQGDHHISYGDWAKAFLDVMGAPRCHENLVVTIAWQAQEGTQAAWNPLATTHRMEGSTDFNSVGVQNFRSLAQGLQATKETIDNGWDVYGYGSIVRSMRGCGDAMATARAIANSRWCYGCAGGRYVLGIVPSVEASFETYAAL